MYLLARLWPQHAVSSETLALDLESWPLDARSILVFSLQRHGFAHGDVASRNILISNQEGLNCRLIDYGHARLVSEAEAATFLTKDLMCGSDEAVLGRRVSLLGDWQSLIYTLKQLSSQELPWAQAATAGDRRLARLSTFPP